MQVNPLLALLDIAGVGSTQGASSGADGLLASGAESTNIFSSLLTSSEGAQLQTGATQNGLAALAGITAATPATAELAAPVFGTGQNLLLSPALQAAIASQLEVTNADVTVNATTVTGADDATTIITAAQPTTDSADVADAPVVPEVTPTYNDKSTNELLALLQQFTTTPVAVAVPPQHQEAQQAAVAQPVDATLTATIPTAAPVAPAPAPATTAADIIASTITDQTIQDSISANAFATALFDDNSDDALQLLAAATNATVTPKADAAKNTDGIQTAIARLVAQANALQTDTAQQAITQQTVSDSQIQNTIIADTATAKAQAEANVKANILASSSFAAATHDANVQVASVQEQLSAQQVLAKAKQREQALLPSIGSVGDSVANQSADRSSTSTQTQTANPFLNNVQNVNANATQNFASDTDASDDLSIDGTSSLPGTGKLESASTTVKSTETAESTVRTPSEQVALQVQKLVKQGISHIKMTLEPEHLGKVEIKIDYNTTNQRTSVMVIADKQETLDLLQRDSRSLQQSLQDAGVKTQDSGLQFSLRGGSQGFDSFQQAQQDREYLTYNRAYSNGGSNDLTLDEIGTSPAYSYSGNNVLDIHA